MPSQKPKTLLPTPVRYPRTREPVKSVIRIAPARSRTASPLGCLAAVSHRILSKTAYAAIDVSSRPTTILGLRPSELQRGPCRNHTSGRRSGLEPLCCTCCILAIAWASCGGELVACQSGNSNVYALVLPCCINA